MKTTSVLPLSEQQRAQYLELAAQLRRPDLPESGKNAIVRDAVRRHRLDALTAVWTGEHASAYKQTLLFVFICIFAAFFAVIAMLFVTGDASYADFNATQQTVFYVAVSLVNVQLVLTVLLMIRARRLICAAMRAWLLGLEEDAPAEGAAAIEDGPQVKTDDNTNPPRKRDA